MKDIKAVFWDFDGTLAYRDGFFSKALLDILDEHEKAHNYQLDQIRPYLKDGFPWHQPEKPHPELNDPKQWWEVIENLFIRAYQGIGFSPEKAVQYAQLAHLRYIDSAGFLIYDDTIETLKYFSKNGWRNVIVSNHVPELPAIVNALGLECYIFECISSACVGYEKPNSKIFQIALEEAGNPTEVWMVGDNLEADVKGAENAGIKAIQVRSPLVEDVKYYAKDLSEVIAIIESNTFGGSHNES